MVSVSSADELSAEAWVWSEGGGRRLEGLPERVDAAGRLDEDHAVVTAPESGGTAIHVGPVADLTCTRVGFSKDDVRLAE